MKREYKQLLETMKDLTLCKGCAVSIPKVKHFHVKVILVNTLGTTLSNGQDYESMHEWYFARQYCEKCATELWFEGKNSIMQKEARLKKSSNLD